MSVTLDVLNSSVNSNLKTQRVQKLSSDLLVSSFVGLGIVLIFVISGIYDPLFIGLMILLAVAYFVGHRLLHLGHLYTCSFIYFTTPAVIILSFAFLFPQLRLESLLFLPLIIDSFAYFKTKRSLFLLNGFLLTLMGFGLGMEFLIHHHLVLSYEYKMASTILLFTSIAFTAFNLQQIINDPRFYIKKLLTMETELFNSNRKYAALFHNTAESIIIIDVNSYRIFESNPALDGLIGQSTDDVENISDLIDGQQFVAFKSLLKKVENEKVAQSVDLILNKCAKRFGNSIQVQCTIIPYSSYHGQVAVILQDLTERQATFDALQESETRLRTIIEGSPAALLHTDTKGNILLASSIASDIHGMSKENIVGYNVEEMIFKESKGGNRFDCITKNLINKEKTEISCQAYNELKVKKYVEGTVSKTFDIVGELSGYLFAYNDTSDVINAEAEQLEQGLIFQSMVQNSFAGIDIVQYTSIDPSNVEGHIVVRNDQMAQILENKYDSYIGVKGFLSLTTDESSSQKEIEHWTGFYKRISAELLKKKSFTCQLSFKVNGKTKVVSAIMHLIMINDKIFLVRMFSDITANKDQEKEILHKNIQLEKYIESNMNLANFAATASHDLISPLRTINSFASLLSLKERRAITSKGQEYLDIILSSSRHMSKMVEDLYIFSQVNSRKINVAQINTEGVLLNVLNSIQVELKQKNAKIDILNLPALIIGDEVKISQVFLNLIRNGIKFNKEGAHPQIKINCYEEETHWHFTVEDNGIGISDKHKTEIFGIFKKLHSQDKFEGSGIGLAICSKVIEAHQGKIWVESVVGDGATFHFTIKKNLA